MWCEDVDIGLSVEDEEAARIVAYAMQHGYTPLYRNANGTFLELHFQPPQLASPSSTTSSSSMAACPVLYGYLEKLGWTNYVQICHEVNSSTNDDSDKTSYDDKTASVKDAHTRTYEVDKPMDFILHVRSSPAALLDRDMPDVGPTLLESTSGLRAHSNTNNEDDEVDVEELERRADKVMIRNAIDTVLRYGAALLDNPLAEEQVYVDEANERQYIRFVPHTS